MHRYLNAWIAFPLAERWTGRDIRRKVTALRAEMAPPTTRLGNSASLGSTTWIVTVIGAVVGCVVGTLLVTLHNGGWRGWPT